MLRKTAAIKFLIEPFYMYLISTVSKVLFLVDTLNEKLDCRTKRLLSEIHVYLQNKPIRDGRLCLYVGL